MQQAVIGIDTSKLRNAVAVAEAGRKGEVRYLGEFDTSTAATRKLVAFNYSKLIWVVILGYLVFDELPGLDTLIGSTIIATAGLYVLYREGRQMTTALERAGTKTDS